MVGILLIMQILFYSIRFEKFNSHETEYQKRISRKLDKLSLKYWLAKGFVFLILISDANIHIFNYSLL